MSQSPLDRTARELIKGLRAGTVTAAAVVEDAIARHDRYTQALNAYKHWDPDRSRTEARAVDAGLGAGLDAGPAMGLPVSFKDIYGVAGMPIFAGSPRELPPRWRAQGTVVRAFRRQLAIVTGKTHTVEFAFGGVGTFAHWDPPRNPWDATAPRVCGGSSTGAGVSLAEGSALFAFGTDTGGSVRIPASVTGQVGLKTTIGRWRVDGIVPLSRSFDTPGVLARTVEDALVAFAVTDPGYDDPEALYHTLDGVTPGEIRLGICDEHFWDNCSPGIVEGVKSALDELTSRGAHLAKVTLPEATEARARFVRASLFGVEGLSYLEEWLPEWIETLDPNIRARFDVAREVTAETYFTELRKLDELAAVADDRLRFVDVLVTPTVSLTPPTVAEVAAPEDYARANGAMTQNTQPVNLLALCSITMPVALDAQGMPVGMQLVARRGQEERLLAVALACEKILGSGRARIGIPPLCQP